MKRPKSELPETPCTGSAQRGRGPRRIGTLARAVVAGAALLTATPAMAFDILIYDDNTKEQVAQNACRNLGYNCARAVADDFLEQFTGSEWDLVVMDIPSNEPAGDWQTALAAHIAAGRAAIHSHWHSQSLNALPDSFGVVVGGSHATIDLARWNAHTLFDTPNAVPDLFDEWVDEWGTNGFFLSVAPTLGAEAAAGFTPTPEAGQAAIIIANEGRTIWNGFLFDDYAAADKDTDSKSDMVELVENQMQWVLGDTPPPPPPPGNCPATPEPTCLAMKKGSLTVREGRAGHEKLAAKLQRGAGFTQADLGNPTVAEGTSYHLCIYDGANTLVADLEIDRSGENCGRRSCWSAMGRAAPDGKGYRYNDGKGDADGVTLIKMKGGTAKQSLVKIVAKNNAHRDRRGLATGITAGLAGAESATMQLHGSDAAVCLSTSLSKVTLATPTHFQAR